MTRASGLDGLAFSGGPPPPRWLAGNRGFDHREDQPRSDSSMAHVGRDESDRRPHPALRRLILGAIAAAAVLGAGIILQQGAVFRAIRERAYPIPSGECHKAGNCDEKALQVQNREAQTADAAFDVALFQFALGLLGLGGVGFTVYYARQAWKEAERSATAAREALEHTQADAAEQAERFTRQLAVANRRVAC